MDNTPTYFEYAVYYMFYITQFDMAETK